MPLVPTPKNCDPSVKKAIQILTQKLGLRSNPTFTSLTLDTLTLSKICTVAAGLNVLRVTGLQTDSVAMTGTLRGAYIDVSNGNTAATGTIRGMELKARTEAPGDTGNDVNVLEGLSISADSKGHSVTTMRAAEFILDGKTGGTIDEAVGLRIANNLQADKATVSYGLQIYRDSFDYTADIQLSNNNIIKSSGNSTIFQPATDSTTFFQILDADGGTPIFCVDATNERVGIKIVPTVAFEVLGQAIVGNKTNGAFFLGALADVGEKGMELRYDGVNGYIWVSEPGVAYHSLSLVGSVIDIKPSNVSMLYANHSGVNIGGGYDPYSRLEVAHGVDPYITMQNLTSEDTDRGRETRINFRGMYAGTTKHTLGRIEVSHYGTGTNIRGRYGVYLNDGTVDIDVMTERFTILYNGLTGINEIAPETLTEWTHAQPYLTLHNSTHEDTDGDRESRINFKGEQGVSPFEETTLARIEVSHDGSGADDKGKIVFSTNDGDDSDTPTDHIAIDAAGNTYIGDGGTTNYTHIDSGGRLLLGGTAQTWEDIRIVPGAFQFPGVADPTLQSWQPGGAGATYKVYKFLINDEVHFTCQIPHNYKEGSDLKPHLHWTPCDRGNEENGNTVGWKIDYSWANTDAAFVSSATIDLSDACSGIDDQHELTDSGTITGTNKTISSVLQIRLYRSDTGADDIWVGATAALSPAILEFDLHYEVDSLGSDLELVKDAP